MADINHLIVILSIALGCSPFLYLPLHVGSGQSSSLDVWSVGIVMYEWLRSLEANVSEDGLREHVVAEGAADVGCHFKPSSSFPMAHLVSPSASLPTPLSSYLPCPPSIDGIISLPSYDGVWCDECLRGCQSVNPSGVELWVSSIMVVCAFIVHSPIGGCSSVCSF